MPVRRRHAVADASADGGIVPGNIPTINEHLKTIYADGELLPEATIRKFLIVRQEGSRQVSRNIDLQPRRDSGRRLQGEGEAYNLKMLETAAKALPEQHKK